MKKELKYVCSYIVCLGIVFCIVLLVRKNIYLKNVEQAEKNIYNKIDYSLVYKYDYYKENYPDIAQSCNYNKYDMLKYFIDYGMSQGQRASEDFDVNVYYRTYEDLRQTFGGNLKRYYQHYIEYGYNEGRITTE